MTIEHDFLVAFSPNVLESYPATLLGAIKAAPGRESAVERSLAATVPDVRFVAIFNPVVASHTHVFPAITARTVAVDITRAWTKWTRSAAVDIDLVAIFQAIIAGRTDITGFTGMARTAIRIA